MTYPMKLPKQITALALLLCVCLAVRGADVSETDESVSSAEASLAQGEVSVDDPQESELDMNEYIFGHIGDAYEWHITTIKGKPIAIYLPVIVYSKATGWHAFSSHRVAHGGEYNGFRIAQSGEEHEGKIVETMPDGTLRRPVDISITKNVLSLFINSLLLVWLVLGCARWYRRHDVLREAPKGLVGAMEMMVMMIYDDVIKDAIGKDADRYAPYLLTAFFFIFINNIMGIVPFFPGGANLTGNIAVTLFLAVCTFLAVNLFGNKHYWKDILWPDVPVFLKAIPLMPVIEIIGMFTKPFSLMVRLFANIMAGHIMLLGVVAVIFLTAQMGTLLNGGLTVIAVMFGVFMDVLELLVAFLQAYVFTMLSSVFIGLSRQQPEVEKA